MELLERGRKLRQSGDVPTALAASEAAADSEPLGVAPQIEMARLLCELGRLDEGEATLAKVIEAH
jgi:Tetratricopeptide repeat